MRRALLLLLLGAASPDARVRLADAKRASAEANAQADALTAAAARESNAARRAQAEQRALARRVDAAAATVRAAEARVALVEGQQQAQRARLAETQAPVARLLSALTAIARRPTVAAVAQPGSLDDLVHVRAVLGATLPVVQARATGVRAELAETRRLAESAALAVSALRQGRADLEQRRTQLATLEAQHRGQARVLTRDAIAQSDRALALGERARDLVDQLTEAGEADVTAAELASLPGPAPRPLASTGALVAAQPAYRLPVRGTLLTGLGEVSDAGVRARGLTFAVAPAAPVAAPAAGIVRYAGRFRGYGAIVLVDHGGGWTSLLTGLGVMSVRPGTTVVAGAPVGRAGAGDAPRITVELRRRGRPVDIAGLIG